MQNQFNHQPNHQPTVKAIYSQNLVCHLPLSSPTARDPSLLTTAPATPVVHDLLQARPSTTHTVAYAPPSATTSATALSLEEGAREEGRHADPGYVFDKESLLRYDHMSFGGAPVEVETEEEADELILKNEEDSANEAEVLSAPPKLVYNKFVLRLARDILGAVVNQWNDRVLVIDKVIPPNWKDEPAGRILELCILHLAMAEITSIGTRHQIVINEAVDLAKRFCDGCAPRIINGCLRTFVKNHSSMGTART